MNAAISLTEPRMSSAVSVDTLMVELDRYRKQSQWLQQVNELHGRLAGATDVPGIMEAFSVWLNALVAHDLLGYQSADRKRTHVLCSCHGPERRRMRRAAAGVFTRSGARRQGGGDTWNEDGYRIRTWYVPTMKYDGELVLLRRGARFGSRETGYVDNVLSILGESLQRALDYEDLFEQARRDTLTGLENRRVFEERIGPLLESARRHGHPITIASMDLDRFKQVNDLQGHAAGDLALRQVARTLAAMVRTSDLLARMGGDEFLLVLPDTGLEAAKKLAGRLCRAVDGLKIDSGAGRLGISIGLVQWQPGMGREEWLQRADEVLYQAKSRGRSRVCF